MSFRPEPVRREPVHPEPVLPEPVHPEPVLPPASASLVDPFRLVAFDMDGVLVDSFQCWWMLLNDTLASRGDRPLTREEFQSTWGQDVEADRRRFFPDWSIEHLTRYYEERFPEYMKHVETEPDAAGVLDRLREEGKLLAVATNSPVKIATTLLTHAGLATRLDRIVGVDLVEKGKPEPDLLVHIADDMGVRVSEMCYVGDSEFDAGAARAAGVFFIGYRRVGDSRIERLADLSAWSEPTGSGAWVPMRSPVEAGSKVCRSTCSGACCCVVSARSRGRSFRW